MTGSAENLSATVSTAAKRLNASDRREAFIRHYMIHQNASRAYREAGYKDGPGTRQSAHRLLTSADIQARLDEKRQELLATLDVKVEDLMRRFRDIAFADIADIVGLHIGACRFCHGAGHAYQWRTVSEYHADLAETQRDLAWGKGQEPGVQPEGGYGYDANLPPHLDCPECDGDGIPRIVFKDTRLFTDSERAVFAGTVGTRYGVKYRLHDQLTALIELAKRAGFYSQAVDREENAVARMIREIQDRGHMQRMPLR